MKDILENKIYISDIKRVIEKMIYIVSITVVYS